MMAVFNATAFDVANEDGDIHHDDNGFRGFNNEMHGAVRSFALKMHS